MISLSRRDSIPWVPDCCGRNPYEGREALAKRKRSLQKGVLNRTVSHQAARRGRVQFLLYAGDWLLLAISRISEPWPAPKGKDQLAPLHFAALFAAKELKLCPKSLRLFAPNR
jgi:hypothetical protein